MSLQKDQENLKIIELRSKGLKIKEIAKIFGVVPLTITNRLKKAMSKKDYLKLKNKLKIENNNLYKYHNDKHYRKLYIKKVKNRYNKINKKNEKN